MNKAELEVALAVANARIAEDSVTIQNLYIELDRVRECLKNSSHTESIDTSSYNDIQTKKTASRSRKGI